SCEAKPLTGFSQIGKSSASLSAALGSNGSSASNSGTDSGAAFFCSIRAQYLCSQRKTASSEGVASPYSEARIGARQLEGKSQWQAIASGLSLSLSWRRALFRSSSKPAS